MEAGRPAWMAVTGVGFIILALIWNLDFPINKNLWTSSFVCLVGGISLLLLSLFYYVIDVLGYKKWAFFFKVIGMNSILIYISGHFINWEYATMDFFNGSENSAPAIWAPVVMSICYMAVKWAFMYFLYPKKYF